MIYLTGPYYHGNQNIRSARATCINDCMVELYNNSSSKDIFCDVIQKHVINCVDSDARLGSFIKILANCEQLIVYPLPGWERDDHILRIRTAANTLGIQTTVMPVSRKHLEGTYAMVWSNLGGR